ncbi:MAG: methyltransferase domain-containing protein [Asticcacaulis sp.]
MPEVDCAHVRSEIARLKSMVSSSKSKLDLGALMGGDGQVSKSIVDLIELQSHLIENLIGAVNHKIENLVKEIDDTKIESDYKFEKTLKNINSDTVKLIDIAVKDAGNSQKSYADELIYKEKEEISNLSKQFNSVENILKGHVNDSEKAVSALKNKLDLCESKISYLERDISKLELVDGINSKIDLLESKSKFMERDLSKFALVEEINQKFEILDSKFNYIDRDLKKISVIDDVLSKVDLLDSKLAYVERDVNKINLIDEINNKVELNSQKFAYIERDFAYLRDKSDLAGKEIAKIANSLSNIEKQFEGSEIKSKEFAASIFEYSNELRSAVDQINLVKSEISSINKLGENYQIKTEGSAHIADSEIDYVKNIINNHELQLQTVDAKIDLFSGLTNEARIDLLNLKNYIDVVSGNIDNLNIQLSSLSMRMYALSNASGLMMGQDIENYNTVDRLQDVMLRQRAQLIELEFNSASALPKPKIPKMREPIPVEEIWRKFEELAPHNFDIFKTAFEVGAASYVGFPPESCSTSGVHQADQFEAFLLPYLMRSRATLDIGCGPQAIPSYLRKANIKTLHGVDLLAPYEEHPFVFAQTAGEFLPWEDESFDLIASGGAIDHYYLLDQGMREANRVLTPGGHYVLSITLFDDAPFYDPYSFTIKPYDSEHLFHVNRAWFDDFMYEHGFKLVEEMTFHLPFVYGLLAFKKM